MSIEAQRLDGAHQRERVQVRRVAVDDEVLNSAVSLLTDHAGGVSRELAAIRPTSPGTDTVDDTLRAETLERLRVDLDVPV
ncbi:hypothetical protein [Protofrankia symbiont of Coriaria ruscifolia]|uniref:hypothetical protein n=1 Tax=Protofrankia symbiont of Coriaria ruscifolia TaxID=1306542 RepID=UPI0010418A0F|nr:hypothetical protein [Protofrankia symbiont of Coriaria ruscifolia]